MNEAFVSFLPLILIFVIFYFLLIRPQQKKMKEHKEMINKIKRGDEIVTAGGVFAKVSRVIDENKIEAQISRTRTTEEKSPKNTTLYFSILQETKDLLKAIMSLIEEYYLSHDGSIKPAKANNNS